MRTSQKNRDAPLDTYVDRVNRALDVIVTQLDRPWKLDEVARAAGFSPYHFHRVFQALMGETLGQFVKRVRLERALSIMARTPERSLTEVALSCGFSSSSDFSRNFKQRYGVPPSQFDVIRWREDHREGVHATVEAGSAEGGVHLERLPAGENPDGFEVQLRELPARDVAYIRVLDPYQGTGVVEAAKRLVAWAVDHGAADGRWLGYMWDDPEVVATKDCRYDVGVEVSEALAERVRSEGGEVGHLRFPSMRVAEVPIRGGIDLELRALDWLYGTWLPTSGFVPDDQPCFEAWCGLPFAHGYEHFELEAHLPVVRAP